MIGIGVSIFVIVLAIVLISNEKSDVIEVEDTLDKEVTPETEYQMGKGIKNEP